MSWRVVGAPVDLSNRQVVSLRHQLWNASKLYAHAGTWFTRTCVSSLPPAPMWCSIKLNLRGWKDIYIYSGCIWLSCSGILVNNFSFLLSISTMPSTWYLVTEASSDDEHSSLELFEAITNNDTNNDTDNDTDNGDANNDDNPPNENIAFNEAGFWSPDALAVLQEHKEKWIEGDKTDWRVGLAVQAVVDAGHGNRHNLKKTVKKWLQCQSTTSSKYGPNHKPTLRTVIAFYEAERIAREVKEEMKSSRAFDQRKHIGIYARVVTRVMQEVLCDKECLQKMKEWQVRWSKRGPPWNIQWQ